MEADLAPQKMYQEAFLGIWASQEDSQNGGLLVMPQHGASWGLRFWAPNRFFMIWGRASWSRIWAGFQNQHGRFREHSVETERSFFLKIHFGRGVHVEAENGSPFDGVARQGSNWRVPDEAPKWKLEFRISGSILEGCQGGGSHANRRNPLSWGSLRLNSGGRFQLEPAAPA